MRGKYFSEKELACRCCGQEGVQKHLISSLDALRTRLKRPIVLTSAYRCSKHPVEARKKKPGKHNLGIAVDIACKPWEVAEIVHHAYTLGFRGFGYSDEFLHIDLRESPAGWFY